MGPPHIVLSCANSLGGQVPQLPQGLDEATLFQQQLVSGQPVKVPFPCKYQSPAALHFSSPNGLDRPRIDLWYLTT
jgi:hypothetical protein